MVGDGLIRMDEIPDKSVDMVCCDLPFGITANKLDIIIDPVRLWEHYWRVAKPNAAILLFGMEKFTAFMTLSDPNYRYKWVWNKVLKSGHLNANRMPLSNIEDIMVFYKKQPIYNPQKTKGKPNNSMGRSKERTNNNYGKNNFVDNARELGDMKHPDRLLTFSKPHPSRTLHRTEKPVELLEYLVKTYTHEGMTVLDNCAGSGSLGEACDNLNRNYILIEKDLTCIPVIYNRLKNLELS